MKEIKLPVIFGKWVVDDDGINYGALINGHRHTYRIDKSRLGGLRPDTEIPKKLD